MKNKEYNRLLNLLVSSCRDYRYLRSNGFNGGFILETLSKFIFDLSAVLLENEYLCVDEVVTFVLNNYDTNYD